MVYLCYVSNFFQKIIDHIRAFQNIKFSVWMIYSSYSCWNNALYVKNDATCVLWWLCALGVCFSALSYPCFCLYQVSYV